MLFPATCVRCCNDIIEKSDTGWWCHDIEKSDNMNDYNQRTLCFCVCSKAGGDGDVRRCNDKMNHDI